MRGWSQSVVVWSVFVSGCITEENTDSAKPDSDNPEEIVTPIVSLLPDTITREAGQTGSVEIQTYRYHDTKKQDVGLYSSDVSLEITSDPNGVLKALEVSDLDGKTAVGAPDEFNADTTDNGIRFTSFEKADADNFFPEKRSSVILAITCLEGKSGQAVITAKATLSDAYIPEEMADDTDGGEVEILGTGDAAPADLTVICNGPAGGGSGYTNLGDTPPTDDGKGCLSSADIGGRVLYDAPIAGDSVTLNWTVELEAKDPKLSSLAEMIAFADSLGFDGYRCGVDLWEGAIEVFLGGPGGIDDWDDFAPEMSGPTTLDITCTFDKAKKTGSVSVKKGGSEVATASSDALGDVGANNRLAQTMGQAKVCYTP